MKQNEIRLKKDHFYSKKYNSLERFISYFNQVDLTRKLDPESILEVGTGNKTIYNFLKQNGHNIVSCDIYPELEPDFIADIRSLPFKNDSFELILACDILEHLPWQDVQIAISELYRVTKKYVIVCVPYGSRSLEIIAKIPFLYRFFKKPYTRFIFSIPKFYNDIDTSKKMHYWELARKSYPLKKMKNLFTKNFRIISEDRPILTQGYFFVLEKSIPSHVVSTSCF